MDGASNLSTTPQLLKTTEMTDFNRKELVEAYIDRVLDNMSITDLMRIVGDQLDENLSAYSDEELLTEVEEYYPELLESA
jgi:hypothetical protein